MIKCESLLYGTAYYAEYYPSNITIQERVPKDFSMMKEAGMNVIRIAESSWSTWEPHDNQFDFTLLHYIIQSALQFDLNVIIGTPTYAVPAWLVNKHPDILAETHDGPSRYGHRQNMDITNPQYLFYAERIIRKLMAQVTDYDNIIGYQLDNETKAYDTCSKTAQDLFVAYLKDKFETTDALNDAFGLTYWSNRITSWDDVPDIRGTINGSFGAEYERFQRKLVTDFLSWQAGIVQEYIHDDQFITQNFDYGWRDYSYGLQPEVNQFQAVKSLTVPGFDIYHPSRNLLTGAEISFGGAIGRAVSHAIGEENYLVLETQAQGNLEWLPYQGQLRLQAFSHLANGSNSVMYWHWHSIHNAIESYWKGVLSHDLEPNETYQDVCKIGKEFHTLSPMLCNLKKTCEVAIMVDNASLNGLKWFPVSDSLGYNDIVRWLYDTLYQLNMECDVIPADYEALSEYKLVIVPALYSACTDTIQRLNKYVTDGGHLLATFKTAFSDENLQIRAGRQPYEMTDCFGVTYDTFTTPVNVGLDGEFTASRGSVTNWMELLHADTDTQIWSAYDEPHYKEYAAITHHQFGNGTATYLGCYFEKTVLAQVLTKVIEIAEIPRSHITFPLIKKCGVNEAGNQIIYYLNYSDEAMKVSYDGATGTIILENDSLGNKEITNGTMLEVKPWNLIIIEI